MCGGGLRPLVVWRMMWKPMIMGNWLREDDFVSERENAFGFVATQFSLSYAHCAEVRQFDDELEGYEEEEQTLGANGPGCQNNNGEYQEAQFEDYCNNSKTTAIIRRLLQ